MGYYIGETETPHVGSLYDISSWGEEQKQLAYKFINLTIYSELLEKCGNKMKNSLISVQEYCNTNIGEEPIVEWDNLIKK